MITINFFKDGAYIKGHDIEEICSLVSYAMWCCIGDCFKENADVFYYESGNDEAWSKLGLTYIKINLDIEEHSKIFNRFKENITCWLKELYKDRVKIISLEKYIDWDLALKDAKKEQCIT